jgi:hypothetical protein
VSSCARPTRSPTTITTSAYALMCRTRRGADRARFAVECRSSSARATTSASRSAATLHLASSGTPLAGLGRRDSRAG